MAFKKGDDSKKGEDTDI